MRKITLLLSFLTFTSAYAGMSDSDKSKAWECSGIYMANYFLPSGEEFEYSMKEKSMAWTFYTNKKLAILTSC